MSKSQMKLFIKAGILLMVSVSLNAVSATQVGFIGKVTDVYVVDAIYGDCIVKVDDFSSPTNNCPANWVSLGCDGAYNSAVTAGKMYDAAQMSLALRNVLWAVVDDNVKYNGYCTATQLMLTTCIGARDEAGNCSG
ncbi:hypothetical protein N9P41_01430 [Pseudomonadales bacterium]|nr:hypothetical protein [Pseudomonadales bacterium]